MDCTTRERRVTKTTLVCLTRCDELRCTGDEFRGKNVQESGYCQKAIDTAVSKNKAWYQGRISYSDPPNIDFSMMCYKERTVSLLEGHEEVV